MQDKQTALATLADLESNDEYNEIKIGRASCRERV